MDYNHDQLLEVPPPEWAVLAVAVRVTDFESAFGLKPGSLDDLVRILLDPERTASERAHSAAKWADQHEDVVLWAFDPWLLVGGLAFLALLFVLGLISYGLYLLAEAAWNSTPACDGFDTADRCKSLCDSKGLGTCTPYIIGGRPECGTRWQCIPRVGGVGGTHPAIGAGDGRGMASDFGVPSSGSGMSGSGGWGGGDDSGGRAGGGSGSGSTGGGGGDDDEEGDNIGDDEDDGDDGDNVT